MSRLGCNLLCYRLILLPWYSSLFFFHFSWSWIRWFGYGGFDPIRGFSIFCRSVKFLFCGEISKQQLVWCSKSGCFLLASSNFSFSLLFLFLFSIFLSQNGCVYHVVVGLGKLQRSVKVKQKGEDVRRVSLSQRG